MKKSLFDPIKLGALDLPNRIVMSSMSRDRSPNGVPTALNALYYAQRAGAGLIVVESTAVSARGVGWPNTPGIFTAEQIAGWRRVTDAVHEEGGRIFIQLWHCGRNSHPLTQPGGALPVGPSAIDPKAKLRHASVILVDSLEEMIDLAELAWRFPVAPRAGLAVVSDSGAVKGMIIDQCDALGLDLPAFPEPTAKLIEAVLPEFVGATNPLDLTAQAITHPSMYEDTLKPILADDRIGSVLLTVIIAEDSERAIRKSRNCLEPLLDPPKPAAIGLLGDEARIPEEAIAEARAGGVPFFRSHERAIRALARFTDYGRSLEAARDGAEETPFPAPQLPSKGTLGEHASKAYLAALGVPVPHGALADSLDQAKQLATQLRYPLALKLQANTLTHKSDVGAIELNVADAAHLETAWRRLQGVGSTLSDADIQGILVEEMGKAGLEMILGGRRDPDWGAVVVMGLGGIWAEALDDVRAIPADSGREEIRAQLKLLRGYRLLSGARDMAPRDVDAYVDLAVLLGRLLEARPEIREIEINPLTLYETGAGGLALDALIVSEEEGSG